METWETFSHRRGSLTPEQCVRQGGHCWLRSSMVTAGSIPTYSEGCKHCSASRQGRPREAMDWAYPEGQP